MVLTILDLVMTEMDLALTILDLVPTEMDLALTILDLVPTEMCLALSTELVTVLTEIRHGPDYTDS
jgi:hypothetical protein